IKINREKKKKFLKKKKNPIDLNKGLCDNNHKRIFEVAEHVKEMEEDNE
ncbi:hypothetical protein, partial [Staphylococcus aureus]